MKNLKDFVKESIESKVNENKIDYEQLKWDASELFDRWIKYADSKRKEIKDIESFIDDDNDMAYDSILSQLENEYDYDYDELDEDDKAIEAIKAGARETLNNF